MDLYIPKLLYTFRVFCYSVQTNLRPASLAYITTVNMNLKATYHPAIPSQPTLEERTLCLKEGHSLLEAHHKCCFESTNHVHVSRGLYFDLRLCAHRERAVHVP